MLKNKKGQISTLQSVVIGIFIIGIVLGMGILLVREVADTMTDQTGSVVNETIDPINGTLVWLDYNKSSVNCWQSFGVSEVRNLTDDVVIHTGNYTTDWRGAITATSELAGDGTYDASWNVSYTYKYDDSAECRGVEDTITSVGKIPTWLAIFVIVFIVGVLLALVFKYIPRSPGGGVAEI